MYSYEMIGEITIRGPVSEERVNELRVVQRDLRDTKLV